MEAKANAAKAKAAKAMTTKAKKAKAAKTVAPKAGVTASVVLKFVRITPTKARRVALLIQGKSAGEAMILLKFMPYRGAALMQKILKSAMANAEVKEVSEPENMKIVKVCADRGPMMKRMMPRAMGRGSMIKKKTSHITLVLSD
jgi:large subunit ribosomal protein L22